MDTSNKHKEYIITEEVIEGSIIQEIYTTIGYRTSLCLLILNTGYEALGSFAPILIEDIDVVAGKKAAKAAAMIQARAHLESISLWRKTVTDIKEAKEAEKENLEISDLEKKQ